MRVGCADIVITPPVGISLAGFSARHEGARGIHDDLHARALVFDDGGRRAALVVCDLCELDRPAIDALRWHIERATGIQPGSVMIAATHTHAAPATFPLYSAPPDPSWLEQLPQRVARAADAACRNLAPAILSLGTGQEATVGRNRRRPDGPTDPTVSVVRADRTGASPALLVHYACHPTVLGPDNVLISRDYVGFALDAVMRATGGWAMFANGACGDVNVGHSADRSALGLPIAGRTFERAEALGLRLAGEAARAAAATRPVTGPAAGSVVSRTRTLAVPLRPAPPLSETRAQVAGCRQHLSALQAGGAGEDAITTARLDLFYAELALQWAEQRGTADVETIELQVVALDNVALVGLPGEFFAESGLRLRTQSPFAHTIVVGYANGGIGYAPPTSAFAEGGYETRLAPWSKVVPEAEALILDAALALLEDAVSR